MKIKETVHWTAQDVMNMCINNCWYTEGDSESYHRMLEFVRRRNPTKSNIYIVSLDIYNHSNKSNLYVEAIMFELSNKYINRFYEIN